MTEELELRILGRNLTDELYFDSADEVASLARGRSFTVGPPWIRRLSVA